MIIAKQNRYLRRFAEAGASTPTTAKALSDVGCRESGAFRGLVARGVFIECEPGKYFVDEQRAVAFRQCRRKQAVIVLMALAAAALVAVCLRLALHQSQTVHAEKVIGANN